MMFGKMGRALVFLLLCGFCCLSQRPVQLRGGLPHFFSKLNGSDTLRVVYLGGSITQAPGYRVKFSDWLKNNYPGSPFSFFNAGVGGTGSDLGVFRLGEDVLSRRPDLVFIEFAVNDQDTDTAKIRLAMKGIISQLQSANKHIAICLLYTLSESMLATYQAGHLPNSVQAMERLASRYKLPSINFAYDVLGAQSQGTLLFRGQDNPQSSKLIFSTDGTHPLDAGHGLYNQTLQKAWGELESMRSVKHPSPKSSKALPFGRYEPASFGRSAGWKKVMPDGPQSNFLSPFPGLIYSEDEKDSLVIEFKGTLLGVEDVIGPASNGFSISIDGKQPFKVIRFDKYCKSYRRHYFLLEPLSPGTHRVVIRPDFSPIDKLNILKPENRAGFDQGDYVGHRMYIGKILINGKPKI